MFSFLFLFPFDPIAIISITAFKYFPLYLCRVGFVEVRRKEVGAETETFKSSAELLIIYSFNPSINLYPCTNVEKSMLSMEPERQSGRRTEHRQRIFGKEGILFCMFFSLYFVRTYGFCWFLTFCTFLYLYRLSSLDPGISANIVGVKPIKLLVHLLSEFM